MNWISDKIRENFEKISDLESRRCVAQRTFLEGRKTETQAMGLIDYLIEVIEAQEDAPDALLFA